MNENSGYSKISKLNCFHYFHTLELLVSFFHLNHLQRIPYKNLKYFVKYIEQNAEIYFNVSWHILKCSTRCNVLYWHHYAKMEYSSLLISNWIIICIENNSYIWSYNWNGEIGIKASNYHRWDLEKKYHTLINTRMKIKTIARPIKRNICMQYYHLFKDPIVKFQYCCQWDWF